MNYQLVAESRPLCPDTELEPGDRILGETEKNSFISCLGRGGHLGLMPQDCEPDLGRGSREFYDASPRGRASDKHLRTCRGCVLSSLTQLHRLSVGPPGLVFGFCTGG